MEIVKKHDFSGETLDFLPHREPGLYISSEDVSPLNVMNTPFCFKNEFVRASWGFHNMGLHNGFTLDQLGVRGLTTSQDPQELAIYMPTALAHCFVTPECLMSKYLIIRPLTVIENTFYFT